ncbi:MAG: hypothetical protein SPH07_05800 [Eubacteriales bacterium]|nr:hypothetical protein [Eubacteriales bacterium]MDY5440165.1 hypothetical protein [Eubacteriales bacterium]
MSRLTNRKLNNLLKDAVDKLEIPDVKNEVKKTPIYASENSVHAKKKVSVSKKRAFVSVVCACCIVAVCTCLGVIIPNNIGGGVPMSVNNVSYVTVDVNPSVTIKLVDGKVTDIVNNNKEGGVVLAGIENLDSLKGKDVESTIDAVLDSCLKSGYLVYNDVDNEQKKNAVQVGVVNDNGDITEQIKKTVNEVSTSVKNFFKERNLFALVVADIEIKDEYDKIYKEYGITLSKYNLIKDAYIVQNDIVIFTDSMEKSEEFKKFVSDNKSTRVSTLYAEIAKEEADDVFELLYSAIYGVLQDEVSYEEYLVSNNGKTNTELDAYIESELNKITTAIGGVSALLEWKYVQNMITIKSYFVDKSIEIFDAIQNIAETIEGIAQDLIAEFDAWVNGILGFNPPSSEAKNILIA